MDRSIIELYDEYTHRPLPRRVFIERLIALVGSSAAAMAILPLLDNNYANAQTVPANDPRLEMLWVTFKGASGDVRAYLAMPKQGAAKRGGVVVVHENRGANPHIVDVTRRIALEGYNALAVDLLSPQGGTPTPFDDDKARDMFAKIDRAVAVKDLVAAVEYLKSRPDSNGKIGAVGFCFGGGMVNQLAVATGPDLTAAVAYYGGAPSAESVPRIKAKMLLHFAGNDTNTNAGIPKYEEALKSAGVDYKLYMYEGAEHAFNNDTNAARYNKAAADLAWSRTVAFLKSNLA
jgi:carboxymethylenebutenolidase